MKNILGIPVVISFMLVAAIHANAADVDESVAIIQDIKGNVLIEHADKRVPGKKGMVLHGGDSVFVLEKSSIDLSYADCVNHLSQNTLLTVDASTPCAEGIEIGVGLVEITEELNNKFNSLIDQAIAKAGVANASELSASQLSALATDLATAAAEAGMQGVGLTESVAGSLASAGVSGAVGASAISSGIAASSAAVGAGAVGVAGTVGAATSTVAGFLGIRTGALIVAGIAAVIAIGSRTTVISNSDEPVSK